MQFNEQAKNKIIIEILVEAIANLRKALQQLSLANANSKVLAEIATTVAQLDEILSREIDAFSLHKKGIYTFNPPIRAMKPEDVQLIEQAFELLRQVKPTDENRQIIAQKYVELAEYLDDEDETQPVNPESN